MSISLAERRENCSQILLGVYPIENKKTTTKAMSCWFSQSHLLKKILYTELKETDFIKWCLPDWKKKKQQQQRWVVGSHSLIY